MGEKFQKMDFLDFVRRAQSTTKKNIQRQTCAVLSEFSDGVFHFSADLHQNLGASQKSCDVSHPRSSRNAKVAKPPSKFVVFNRKTEHLSSFVWIFWWCISYFRSSASKFDRESKKLRCSHPRPSRNAEVAEPPRKNVIFWRKLSTANKKFQKTALSRIPIWQHMHLSEHLRSCTRACRCSVVLEIGKEISKNCKFLSISSKSLTKDYRLARHASAHAPSPGSIMVVDQNFKILPIWSKSLTNDSPAARQPRYALLRKVS